jgi:hypothetical protein
VFRRVRLAAMFFAGGVASRVVVPATARRSG